MSAGEYPFKWIDVPDEELKDAIPNASGGYIRYRMYQVKWDMVLEQL